MATLTNNELLGLPIEPLQKSRFQVLIDGIPPFLVQAVTIPQPVTSQIEIQQINTSEKVAGRTTYTDMSLTLYQAILPSTMQLVYTWHRLQAERPTGLKGYADTYKKTITVQIVDGLGTVVQQWTCYGCWIKTITGADYSKAEDAKVDITLDISVDWSNLDF
jgi:hypothetical protein